MSKKHLGIKRQFDLIQETIDSAENLDQVLSCRKAVEAFNKTHNNALIMLRLENHLIIKSIEHNGGLKEEAKERSIDGIKLS
jgi:hypothetical protein